MFIQRLLSLFPGTPQSSPSGRTSAIDAGTSTALVDLYSLAQRPQGGSGISKEEADGLRRNLEEIQRVAKERQVKLDALDNLRQTTATHWLEVVQPQAMTFVEKARRLKLSASSPEKAERGDEARVELAQAEEALTAGSDWLAAQCIDGFADSGKALTLYGNLSTLINQTRAEVAGVRAGIDLREEQARSNENLRLLNDTLDNLRAQSNASSIEQRQLIESLTRSLEEGRRRQAELEAQSRSAEEARAAQHEETRRANAHMQSTMDEMATAQMAARAGLNSRSVARRASGHSRSVSLRGPGLRRTAVSEAARDLASRLVDAVPAGVLARAASHPVSAAEVAQAIESAGGSSADQDAATLLSLYLREPDEQSDVWAEARRLAQQVLAGLTGLIARTVNAHPPEDAADSELWALQVRQNMTRGDTPLGRAIDQCLAALRRAERIVETQDEGVSDDEDFVDLGRAGPAHARRTPDASR